MLTIILFHYLFSIAGLGMSRGTNSWGGRDAQKQKKPRLQGNGQGPLTVDDIVHGTFH